MCPLLVPVFQGFFSFLQWPFTVLMKQTRYMPLSSLYYFDVYGLIPQVVIMINF